MAVAHPVLQPDVADAWPDLHVVPTGPRARIAAAVARRLFTHATSRLGVVVSTPTARPPYDSPGPAAPTIVLHRPEEFFGRLGTDGLIGFGEGYLSGAWDSPDLDLLLTTLAAQLPTLVPEPLQRLRSVWQARMPHAHRNSVDHTRGNVSHHYDLSNDLFATFLDPTLSYSSALFPAVVNRCGSAWVAGPPTSTDLEQAQLRKIDRLLDRAGVGAGTRVLEIGTGWGELAVRAARRGATVAR